MRTQYHVGAAAPGPVTPINDNAPCQARVEGNGNADAGDFAVSNAERKSQATLIARAALAGVRLARQADGSWLACRWGLTKGLANDSDVEVWLRRVGALR